jgi:hypothetical protein
MKAIIKAYWEFLKYPTFLYNRNKNKYKNKTYLLEKRYT